MRIGLITQAYYPVLGGVTEGVWHIGQELQRRGHEVTVVTGSAKHPDNRGLRVLRHGFQVPLMSNGANVYLTVGWKLGRMLQRIEQEERFDVVHVQSPIDPGLPIIASKAMRTPKVGTYHTARSMKGPVDLIPVIFRPVFRDAIEKIQHHVAVSRSAEDFIHRYFPDIPMTIIPNGVDTDRFSPELPILPQYDDDVFTILYVGRMDPRKGAKFLFGAIPFLEQRLKNYRVVVVGTGWMQKYYDAYVPLHLRKRVEFVGYVSPEELPRYYRSADVYCSPAIGNESFGIVLLEAMAAGTPVVASDIDGYRWVVEPGVEGLLVPPRSPRHLAEALIQMAQDTAKRKAMSTAGRRKALEYTWSHVVDRLEPIYESLRKGG
ncbi:MAG: glycosyltransferase family 4 protein [Candidatus Kerfeldbacteria bacterium]|nr:glycosyltransferase family 4 protein [Candidatus Kerfeldbacteria bacterium]